MAVEHVSCVESTKKEWGPISRELRVSHARRARPGETGKSQPKSRAFPAARASYHRFPAQLARHTRVTHAMFIVGPTKNDWGPATGAYYA